MVGIEGSETTPSIHSKSAPASTAHGGADLESHISSPRGLSVRRVSLELIREDRRGARQTMEVVA